MNILVVCQYYYPEPFRVNDICEELAKRGHGVFVVTGEPNYPEGYIYDGYENHCRQDEAVNGVTIHRCPIVPRKTGIIYRFLNYFSYPYEAKKYVTRQMTLDQKCFDVVFINQLSPVMMAEPGIVYGKKNGIPVVMYCLDIWPESLIAGGIKRSSLVYKVFYGISKRIYQSVDKVLVTSRMFSWYLKERFGIDERDIEYLPQYAEELFAPLPFKKKSETIDLVFAGNIGEIQSVDTIIGAAERLTHKPVHFHIIGGGTDLDRLKGMAKNMSNVTFYGRKPLEEMPNYYKMADAMLVTLKADPVLSFTVPGKVQSYMAVGKPIIGAIDGETSKIIEEAKCGYCGRAENIDDLISNIVLFVNNDKKEELAKNARMYYEKYFTRERFMDEIEKCLFDITKEKKVKK